MPKRRKAPTPELRAAIDELSEALLTVASIDDETDTDAAYEDLEVAIDAAVRQALASGADDFDPYRLENSVSPDQVTATRLKVLRASAGVGKALSQEALAEHMEALGYGWTRATTMDSERGVRRLSVSELLGLALLFRVPVVELLLPAPSQTMEITGKLRSLTRSEVMELLIGRGGQPGRGGPRWPLAVGATPEGVDGPAREVWRKRQAAEKGSK